MAQSQLLVAALKRSLKANRLTYKDVAAHLQLSEANVKRLFSQNNFSLQRLEAICALMGMDFADLVRVMNQMQQRIKQLSQEQEQELVGNIRLLLVAVLVVNRWQVDEIMAAYQLELPECIQHLARLDRLKLIELLPGNRVKLLVDSDFRWLENGPIERFFDQQVRAEFFHSRFKGAGEQLLFLQGMLSEASNSHMRERMRRLATEFQELNLADQKLPLSEREGCSLALALRPWELGEFALLRRA